MHHVTRILETNDCVRCLLVDFSKAFDPINHVLLITKSQLLYIPSVIINSVINFLIDRTQAVVMDSKRSLKW